MRIIGYIEHPNMKITIFRTDVQLSVKFETGLYEQTYKFRQSEGFGTVNDVAKMIDQPFLDFVEEEFSRMHKANYDAFSRYMPKTEMEEFEVII